MQISLKGETPFFFIKEKNIHLSYEAPGPIDIDWKSLNKDEQKQIMIGIKFGLINGNLLEIANPFVPVSEVPVVEKQLAVVDRTNDNLLAQKVLNKTMPEFKKALGKLEDLTALETLLQVEQAGKKRKRIITLIQSKLDSLLPPVEHEEQGEVTISLQPGVASD